MRILKEEKFKRPHAKELQDLKSTVRGRVSISETKAVAIPMGGRGDVVSVVSVRQEKGIPIMSAKECGMLQRWAILDVLLVLDSREVPAALEGASSVYNLILVGQALMEGSSLWRLCCGWVQRIREVNRERCSNRR